MIRRVVLAALLVAGAVELSMACSSQVPLASMNSVCEFDEQCAEGLACRCVRRRNPDDEGPDEILAPGLCQTHDYRCASDAGVTDSAPVDTGVVDTGSAPDTATSDASGDVADGD